MKWLLLICAVALSAGCLPAQDVERFFYSKSFPGSTPAYTQVTVEKSGEVEYKEAPDDELPLKYKLADAETAEVFGPLGGVYGQEDLPGGRRPTQRRGAV